MDRTDKERAVSTLKDLIVGKTAVVLTDYLGMKVEQMYELRREFGKAGVGYRVVKNTLAKRAFAGTAYEFLGEGLRGTVGVAFSDDPVAPARVLAEATRKSDRLKVKLGYLDGARLEAHEIDALSKLPGKDQLRATLLNVFLAPATKLVGVLAAGPRDLVGVLNARRESLEA